MHLFFLIVCELHISKFSFFNSTFSWSLLEKTFFISCCFLRRELSELIDSFIVCFRIHHLFCWICFLGLKKPKPKPLPSKIFNFFPILLISFDIFQSLRYLLISQFLSFAFFLPYFFKFLPPKIINLSPCFFNLTPCFLSFPLFFPLFLPCFLIPFSFNKSLMIPTVK